MSHYPVGVIVDHPDDIDEVLEPYYEGFEVEPYVYLTRDQVAEEFENIKREIRKGENTHLSEQDRQHILSMTLDEFIEYHYGGMEVDEEGNLLTTYNPESRWDWYVVGGRWNNLLRLKNGKRANYARIREVEFSRDEEAYREAIEFWEKNIDGKGDGILHPLHSPDYYKGIYGSKENYAEYYSTYEFFALVDEWEWHEQGRMGWWAMSDTTHESFTSFRNTMTQILENTDPDKYLVVVDCHI